jgi:methylated-DNA-[protein]-cysteine S-methyltransferase
MSYVYKMMNSPIGRLKLVAKGSRLAAILWEKDKDGRVTLGPMVEADEAPILLETERQLEEYFAGGRKSFSLDFEFAGTEFQKRVWHSMLVIPFGETWSYRQLAREIGSPTASRAVGAANGKNPIAIVAPCHRVIGSSGKLTGYAGGLETKAHLLALEAGKDPHKRRPK